MAQKINVKIIIGSTREGRFGDKPARWIFKQIKNVDGVEAEILDLRDYKLPFFNEPLSPIMKKEPYKDLEVQKWTNKIAEADAFIIVTPEYNHGYSAVLKNAIDYVGPEWIKKAVGFVSYGSAGGARAIEQLRTVAVELQMTSIRNSINIFWPMLMEASKESVDAPTSVLDTLNDGAVKFIEQLLWHARALKTAREMK
jgi:NAD(P)H-dependent FMN reductase